MVRRVGTVASWFADSPAASGIIRAFAVVDYSLKGLKGSTRRVKIENFRYARPSLGCWLAAYAALPLAACQRAGVLDPQGPIASAERLLLINSTAIMLVVVVPVIVATLSFA